MQLQTTFISHQFLFGDIFDGKVTSLLPVQR